MQRLPPDPRYVPPRDRPTWTHILASYAMAAAIPLLLWVASQPLAGTAALASAAGLVVVARRARELIRCFHECRGFAFDLGENVRITVSQIADDDPC